ncbi:MAG: chromosomal replication initiator protein DnaA [Dysgonamonadaceae bacterium]|nr:chromosomal replication initiator protein DnaA [Dysgonamonadaceae bacterium]
MDTEIQHIEIWDKCINIISDNVNNEKIFNTWFKPIKPLKYEKDDFTIQVPSLFFYEYLEEKYADLIHAALSRVIGKTVVLTYRVIVDNSNEDNGHTCIQSDKFANNNDIQRKTVGLNESPSNLNPKPIQDWDSNLNRRLTFNNFFEGQSNKLARTVGESIADNETKNFNPLFIYGASGVGKTHLCHAIGNKISERFPQKKVIYISSHLFQVQFTDASRKNIFNDFINFYQSIDFLIIDDIQDMAGKTATQNAFFHIFNHLIMLGKQIIITADKTPKDILNLEERLLSRFKWGMLAELNKPDIELRRKILSHKIKQDGLNISNEIIDYIAENVADHVRDLEGIITSLIAHSLVFNKEVDMDMAKQVVYKTIKMEKKQITVEKIQDVVSNYFKIELKAIHSRSRKREIVQARQVTMFLSKKYTNCSYAHIGCLVGKRDHATVLHAYKAVQDLMEVDKSFRSTMHDIEELLKQ